MRPCTVCQRSDRSAIDAALNAGETINAAADRLGIPPTTLKPHAKHRGGKPGGPPVEGDAVHPAEPAGAHLPELAQALAAPSEPAPSEPAPSEPASPAAPSSPRMDAVAPPAASPSSAPPEEDLVAYVAELAHTYPQGGASPPPAPTPRQGPGRVCTCCSSPRRRDIDRMLCSGMSAKAIEAALRPGGPSDDAIRHHARVCVPGLLAGSNEALKRKMLGTLVEQIETLTRRTTELLDALEDGGEIPHRLGAIRELRECLKLEANIAGLLTADAEARGAAAREDTILETLLQFPEAGEAVLAALRAQERRS